MSFINKKILLPILICLLSFTTHAFWEKTSAKKKATTVNSVLVQKAQESGVLFSNNNEQYQLIANGRAVRQTTSNTASLSTNQNNTLWSGSRGPYQVFINDSTIQAAQTASASSNDYNQIAFNPRTGNVAILTGKIIVKLTNGVTAESIASNHNIILSANYPHISIAFFTVNKGQDIFSIAQLVAQDVNVVSAEIDTIEHFRQPH